MNTKNFPQEYLNRKQTIIKLHKEGNSIQEIKRKTNTHPSVIKGILQRNESSENKEIFNVNEYDCWIIPTSSTY